MKVSKWFDYNLKMIGKGNWANWNVWELYLVDLDSGCQMSINCLLKTHQISDADSSTLTISIHLLTETKNKAQGDILPWLQGLTGVARAQRTTNKQTDRRTEMVERSRSQALWWRNSAPWKQCLLPTTDKGEGLFPADRQGGRSAALGRHSLPLAVHIWGEKAMEDILDTQTHTVIRTWTRGRPCHPWATATGLRHGSPCLSCAHINSTRSLRTSLPPYAPVNPIYRDLKLDIQFYFTYLGIVWHKISLCSLDCPGLTV